MELLTCFTSKNNRKAAGRIASTGRITVVQTSSLRSSVSSQTGTAGGRRWRWDGCSSVLNLLSD